MTPSDLVVLRAVAEQLAASNGGGTSTFVLTHVDELPAEPQLEALARLARGTALLERDDRAGARAELEAALELGRRHGFDYLAMQCLVLLGVIACTSGDLRTMLAREHRGARRGLPTRLAGLDVVGRRHGDDRLRRAAARRRPPRPSASPPTDSPRAPGC